VTELYLLSGKVNWSTWLKVHANIEDYKDIWDLTGFDTLYDYFLAIEPIRQNENNILWSWFYRYDGD
jgi:hypothetical protein